MTPSEPNTQSTPPDNPNTPPDNPNTPPDNPNTPPDTPYTPPDTPFAPPVPPTPTVPGRPIVRQDDGTYLELDADGTPLGTWVWDDDMEDWTFVPLPLGRTNPKTSDAPIILQVSALIALLGVGATTVAISRRKRAAKK